VEFIAELYIIKWEQNVLTFYFTNYEYNIKF
jgi:hypothetical protein